MRGEVPLPREPSSIIDGRGLPETEVTVSLSFGASSTASIPSVFQSSSSIMHSESRLSVSMSDLPLFHHEPDTIMSRSLSLMTTSSGGFVRSFVRLLERLFQSSSAKEDLFYGREVADNDVECGGASKFCDDNTSATEDMSMSSFDDEWRQRSQTSFDLPSCPRRTMVGFSVVQIREYSQTIGDHPQCKSFPLSLDWAHSEVHEMNVDEYEAVTSTTSLRGTGLLPHLSPWQRCKRVSTVTGEAIEDLLRHEQRRLEKALIEATSSLEFEDCCEFQHDLYMDREDMILDQAENGLMSGLEL